ncbi:hypothetical protein [Mycolicibacterium sp. A43C]
MTEKPSWLAGLVQFWNGVGAWGRIAIVTAPLVVLIALIAVVSLATADSESYDYGYRHAGDAAKTHAQGWSEGSACRSVANLATQYVDVTLDYEDIVAGCLKGLKDRNS